MCFTEDRGMLCVGETGRRGGKGKKTTLTMLCHAKAIKRDAAFFLNHSGQESTIFSTRGWGVAGGVNSGRCRWLQGSGMPHFLHFPPSFLSFSSFSPYPPHISVCLSRKVISITLPPYWFRIQNCPLQSVGVNGKKPFNKGRETLLGMWDWNASLPSLISLGLNFHSPELPSMSRVSPPRPPDWCVNPPDFPRALHENARTGEWTTSF